MPLTWILDRLCPLGRPFVVQSSDEGYSWVQNHPQEPIFAFYHRKYLPVRSYAITSGKRFSIRRILGDRGIPLRFQLHQTPSAKLRSHPESDDFLDRRFRHGENYHAEVHYSKDNDRTWTQLDTNISNLSGYRYILFRRYRDQLRVCRDKIGN